MTSSFKLGVTLLAGAALGATAATVALRADVKPPGIWVASIDVSDPERYARDFAPMAAKIFAAHGGSYLVRGGHPLAMDGATTNRLVIVRFPDVETAKAVYRSQDYQDARKLGDTLAKLHVVIAEGVGLSSPPR